MGRWMRESAGAQVGVEHTDHTLRFQIIQLTYSLEPIPNYSENAGKFEALASLKNTC